MNKKNLLLDFYRNKPIEHLEELFFIKDLSVYYESFYKVIEVVKKDINSVVSDELSNPIVISKKVRVIYEHITALLSIFEENIAVYYGGIPEYIVLCEKMLVDINDLFDNDIKFKKKIKNLDYSLISVESASEIKLWFEDTFSIGASGYAKKQHKQCLKVLKSNYYKFSNNLNKSYCDKKNVILVKDINSLDGIPKRTINIFKSNAKLGGLSENNYMIYLSEGTLATILTYGKNRSFRELAFKKFNKLNSIKDISYNNFDVVKNSIAIKRKLAKLSKYASYSNFSRKDYVFNDEEKIKYVFNKMLEETKPIYDRYKEMLLSEAKKDNVFYIKSWDYMFYENKIMKRLTFGGKDLKIDREKFITKFLGWAESQFDLEFVKKADINDIIIYDVKYKDGHNILMVLNIFEDETRVSNAVYAGSINGHNKKITYINMGCDKASKFIDFTEMKHFMHEMGHTIDEILNKDNLHKNNVDFWDVVEVPSQLLENLAYNVDFLKLLTGKNMKELKEFIKNDLFFEGVDLYKRVYADIEKMKLLDGKMFTKKLSEINDNISSIGSLYFIEKDEQFVCPTIENEYGINDYIYTLSNLISFGIYKEFLSSGEGLEDGSLKDIFVGFFERKIESNKKMEIFLDLIGANLMGFLKKDNEIEILDKDFVYNTRIRSK